MLHDAEDQKHVLIDEAARLAASGAAFGAGEELEHFIRAFYHDVSPVDITGRTPHDLAEAALSLWRFAAEREPGRPKIRVLLPKVPGNDWSGGHSIVQIVNDDMPFLVETVGSAIAGLGLAVELVIHPVLPVCRDMRGRLRSRGPGDVTEIKESMMHVELADDLGGLEEAAIVSQLEAVLADVRIVVGDFAAMRQAVQRMADHARGAPHPVDPSEAAENAEFLTWLDANNFLFFGYRDYAFAEDGLNVVPGSGLGILRDDQYFVFDGMRRLAQSSPEVADFLRSPRLTMISKSNRKSSVRRPVPMDTILLKTFSETGEVTGLRLLVGLFSYSSYFRPPRDIPLLRQKVRRCLERSGFSEDSYNGRALRIILNTFPRDELFQIDEDQLFETALGILQLQQRPRISLFVLRDPFERFITALVYMPRDRYSAEVRRRMASILEQAFNATLASDATHFDESPIARIHFVLATSPGQIRDISIADIERRLIEAGRAWIDRFSEALVRRRGQTNTQEVLRRFGRAFPPSYIERYTPDAAVEDINFVENVSSGAPIAVALSPRGGSELTLKLFHLAQPIPLSDVLPMLENLGLRVVNEIPFEITPAGGMRPVWMQEFQLFLQRRASIDISDASGRFAEALRQVWDGTLENDGFNRLVLMAGLTGRETVILRAYCKFLRQTGTRFSQAYMENTTSAYPELVRLLIRLFDTQFDPGRRADGRDAASEAIYNEILKQLDQVESLDQDRILRAFLTLIRQTLRTNFYQHDENGSPKPYLSVKFASRDIDLLPLPRPLFEIFVYSPRTEGCHLRGGKIARGGIRWSDRRGDLRTEILGLMKAQMVKNAVIVPVGAKGGFVVKRPPEGDRDRLMDEVVACYRFLISGLLDVTDNIQGDTIVPPRDVVRRDGDDSYLVVAADKGTATFSDIANKVAHEYGFWLGDAFASGGSMGYDHKAMGITAKGAWEAVKRHFREMGTDIQTTDFSCVGVGDMSGDVFGNGMLLSRHTKLIAAFNHMHIFIDPDPDPERSWIERKRLFDMPRSTWRDYDLKVLSKGGAIYDRTAKSLRLSPEARQRLALTEESLSPPLLIQALLRQEVDLLWFGGIGTYLKAKHETNMEVGDRANDSLRVNATSIRAKVIGEGANLAMTQRARIEYALNGGRLNTDAIDNSAGVDTSDHEVNIKIGVRDLIAAGHIAPRDRASFLGSLTGEVESLVLRDNYLQPLTLTLAAAEAPKLLDKHVRLMLALERRGRLNRTVESLPDDEAIVQRGAAKRGFTRPELAVLLAYAKIALNDELVNSDLSQEPELKSELLGYFPNRMRTIAPDVLTKHRLCREIIATVIANELLNRMGPSFIEDTQARTGRVPASIARAYIIVREVFGLASVWHDIESLDTRASAATQNRLFLAVTSIADQAMRWFLLSGLPLAIGRHIEQFRPGVVNLEAKVTDLLPEQERRTNDARCAAYVESGAPAALARRIVVLNTLSTAMDIVQISEAEGRDVTDVAKLYLAAGVSFGLLMLRRKARVMPTGTEWQQLAVDAIVDDSYMQQRAIVSQLAAERVEPSADGLQQWIAQHTGRASRLQSLLAEMARTEPPELAMLTVASRQIRALAAYPSRNMGDKSFRTQG
ncbi:MAG: NAD-glutamate dehydrogenase [Acetobacteraceae bacterium]|nr:NAD-glutamate dehydrogenase [Acetobacteraceae bacterium]